MSLEAIAIERRAYAVQHPRFPGMALDPYRVKLSDGTRLTLYKAYTGDWVLTIHRDDNYASLRQIGGYRKAFGVPPEAHMKKYRDGLAFAVKLTWFEKSDTRPVRVEPVQLSMLDKTQ